MYFNYFYKKVLPFFLSFIFCSLVSAAGINLQTIGTSSDNVYRSKCVKGNNADQFNIFKLSDDGNTLQANIDSKHVVLNFKEEYLNMSRTIRYYNYTNSDYIVTVSVDKYKEAEIEGEGTGLPSKIKIVSKKNNQKKTVNAFLFKSGESHLRNFCK